MHQNLDIILWQLRYGKISFIVLVPDAGDSLATSSRRRTLGRCRDPSRSDAARFQMSRKRRPRPRRRLRSRIWRRELRRPERGSTVKSQTWQTARVVYASYFQLRFQMSNGPFASSFFFLLFFSKVKRLPLKILPMTGFELWNSGIENNWSANWALILFLCKTG